MPGNSGNDNAWSYTSREAVGVFSDLDKLDETVEELKMSGFNRAGISIVDGDGDVDGRSGVRYDNVKQMEDDGRTPQSGFVSKRSRAEGEASAVVAPLYIISLTAAAIVAAAGGALMGTIVAAVIGAVIGAGLGLLIARAIEMAHAKRVARQLAHGGLVLWVRVTDQESEERAVSILNRAKARDVHIHQVQRKWGPQDRPLSTISDPMLEPDRSVQELGDDETADQADDDKPQSDPSTPSPTRH